MGAGGQVLSILGTALRAGLRSALRSGLRSSDPQRSRRSEDGRSTRTTSRTTGARPRTTAGPGAAAPRTAPAGGAGYRGDFEGAAVVEYCPDPDGNPDPGEIVWTWVPFEEDHSQGKDRPVLIIAREGRGLLGLMLTSKDHDRDAADEARHGRYWLDLGTGDWDRQGRPSEVRLDRVLRVDPRQVRREGAVLDERRFGEVADEIRRVKGWR